MKKRAKEKAEEAEKILVLLAEAYIFSEKTIDAKYKSAMLEMMLAAKKSLDRDMGPGSVDISSKLVRFQPFMATLGVRVWRWLKGGRGACDESERCYYVISTALQ